MSQNYQNNNNRGSNNNNQQGGKQDREPLRLNVEAVEFDGALKSKMTTTVNLCKTVNALFRPVFTDYEGCIIAPNAQTGRLEISLYFKDKGKVVGNDSIKAILPVTAMQSNNDAYNRIKSLNLRYATNKYELTQDCKDILSEFMNLPKGQKPNWSQLVFERTEQVNQYSFNNYAVIVEIRGLDLLKILKKIYGGKIEGSRVDYNISILRSVGLDLSGFNQNYLINIQQLDTKEVEKLAQEIGMIPSVGAIPIVR